MTKTKKAPRAATPTWQARAESNAVKAGTVYQIVPATYLAKQLPSDLMTRAELERRGHDVDRLVRLNLIREV